MIDSLVYNSCYKRKTKQYLKTRIKEQLTTLKHPDQKHSVYHNNENVY